MHRFVVPAALLLAVVTACSRHDDAPPPVAVDVAPPSSSHAVGPRLEAGPAGRLMLSWMEPGESGATLRYAEFTGDGFGPASEVVNDQRMFVNWADLPSVTAVAGDHLVAHWLRYSADETYAYDVVVSQSFDGGRTWSEPISPHTDATPTEHGFVSMHFAQDGAVLLWLDGRETPGGAMTLRSATITPNGERVRGQLIDDSVCDCCQTDVAVSSSGPVAVYRDRTKEEIRDIYVSRSVEGQWQSGERLFADNWHIPGCPVNGPSIVARDDFVAIAWFSAANDEPVVRAVVSRDGGETFGEPVEIARGRLAGYVGLALLDDESLAVTWVSRNESGTNSVNLRRVSSAGVPGKSMTVGATSQLRVFPQIGVRDSNLVVAWTDDIEGTRRLRTSRIPVRPP